ncbi:hypothetical protein AJ78_08378 [Emergomyces pasteurianus Ep9510]|uniref:Uncharacterized protein n=1 Tax=Emergomyces pasteurianus Ep9510 TaxID=1447872 RepID=A0A1J9P3F4_9EURO|nr:hypothetical protein AJ78_08378 [Emergomyces pasteurianus Ep9510]
MNNDHDKMMKIDLHTVEILQLLALGVSCKDVKTVRGVVLDDELESDDLMARPGYEKVDETVLHEMTVLAQKLDFNST